MRKTGVFVLILVLVIALSIGSYFYGSVRGKTLLAWQTITFPEDHSWASVRQAMRVVKKDFRQNYEGCTLTRLWYDRELTEKTTVPTDADEIIVLSGNFRVGNYGPNVIPVFSPNSRYTGYSWTVCRYGNEWVITSRGYA
jgi:hypothetical protein